MDGRNDPGVVVERSDIWLAPSDEGKRFSANTRLNPAEGAYNDLPALAAGADGRLYIA
jgi:hypothetical protein